VREEVMQAMQGITALYERWKDLLDQTNTASNDEFKWTTDELKTGLKTIEYDLADLEETVRVVESNRSKFKIEESEISTRKGFIQSTKQRVSVIKDELNSARTRGKIDRDQRELLSATKKPVQDRYSKVQQALEQDNEDYIEGSKQRQQQIIQQQDKNVDVLLTTVTTLKEIGNQIDKTIKDQEVLIDDLDRDVTRVDSGFRGAIQKVNKLIDSTKDSTQWCIIAFLAVILVALLALVFLI